MIFVNLIKRIIIKILGYLAYLSMPSSLTVFIHRLRGVNIGTGSRIHRFVYIDEYCPKKIEIGKHVGIGARAIIIAHGRDFVNEKIDCSYKDIIINEKNVMISDYAYIGVGAIILPGVTIGRGAIIGSGAVVTSDIPDYSLAIGVPARVIKNNYKKDENLD